MRKVFGDKVPPFSSTKALSGHTLGAAGVHELIYCLLMMQGGFVAGSANINTLDSAANFAAEARGLNLLAPHVRVPA